MVKWQIKLCEFLIQFVQITIIKGHALTDFIVDDKVNKTEVPTEATTKDKPPLWEFYIDKLSSNEGLRVCNVLIPL